MCLLFTEEVEDAHLLVAIMTSAGTLLFQRNGEVDANIADGGIGG